MDAPESLQRWLGAALDGGPAEAKGHAVAWLGDPPGPDTDPGEAPSISGSDGPSNFFFACRAMARPRQVHGRAVWSAPGLTEVLGASPGGHLLGPEADAVVSRDPEVACAVVTADCVPVLLAGAGGGSVAAVHAGWRGMLAGVIEAAAARLDRPVSAAIGPCITSGRFEVGPEVAEQFDASVVVRPAGAARPYVDLVGEAVRRLRAVGVGSIDHGGAGHLCTYDGRERFYSYRREVSHRGAARTGRNWSILAPRRLG
ncbi:MAG: polyphenol oxidase family protein [Planctomycetota bacterium]